jgi:hypothetical protein
LSGWGANADELRLLVEYRRLLDRVLVLPGFEFTATLAFTSWAPSPHRPHCASWSICCLN